MPETSDLVKGGDLNLFLLVVTSNEASFVTFRFQFSSKCAVRRFITAVGEICVKYKHLSGVWGNPRASHRIENAKNTNT